MSVLRNRHEGRGVLFAHDRGDAVERIRDRRPDPPVSLVALDLEVHVGQRQRGPREPVGDVASLGRHGLEELATRRHAGEEVGHFDSRTDRRANGLFGQALSAVDLDLVRDVGVARA